MAYGTDTIVLDISSKMQALITADSGIVARVCASHCDPIIDAKLAGRGAPFTTVPALIKLISSLLFCHWAWENKLSQSDDKSNLGDHWYEQAWDLLNQIARGELSVDEITDAKLLIVADLDDEFQEGTIFVGSDTGVHELEWASRTETRADD